MEPADRPSLTIVYPMYNEQAIVEELLSEAVEYLGAHFPDYEIVAVNDASQDSTGAILDRLAAGNQRIKVVHHERNRKLGGALRSGLAAATKSLVLYSDADFPFDLHEIPRAVRAIRRADIVSAYRLDRISEGFRRTLQSYVYNLAIRVVFDVHFRDLNFSFKLFRLQSLRKLELKSEGSFIDAEIIIRAHRQGMRIVQIGVDYFPRSRGASTLTGWRVILKILREMCRLYPELRRLKPPSAAASPAPADPAESGRLH